jgi:predicted NUDIX family NTP pyrophosphohydrolase
MAELSAGILLHRPGPLGPQVLLVHPGGPFWARKDSGAWSIPKGLIDPDEDAAAAAKREFAEEVGAVPPGEPVALGAFKQPSGKVVIAFALAGDFDPARLVSNRFEMQWPPRSGRRISVPEVDRAAWFGLDAAREKLLVGQRPILDALLAADRK